MTIALSSPSGVFSLLTIRCESETNGSALWAYDARLSRIKLMVVESGPHENPCFI